MLKSLYKTNKMTFFLVLCFLVIAAPGCNELGGSSPRFSEATPPDEIGSIESTSFKFGVMGDTQWTYDLNDPAGQNPETVAVSYIKQIDQQFINHDVEFVIQVGDLTNYGYDAAIDARAAAAQDLYDAGIGFFPMRGNHEPWGNLFGSKVNNGYAIPEIQKDFPQDRGIGPNTGGATNFSSPTNPAFPNMATEMAGISYAFDYDDGDGNSATYVIIDTWQTDTSFQALYSQDYGTPAAPFILPFPYGYAAQDQQGWISSRLSTRGTDHAFVFSHQPLIASNHADSPFGYLDEHTAEQNTFYEELVANDVAFYISGHDHNHERAMVASPDGLSSVEQLICAPACPKYYEPNYVSKEWRGQKVRRTPISTEFYNSGYYIYTVSGPLVTVEYYSDATGKIVATPTTPIFNFVLTDTWSYSLNGKSFMVGQGAAYSAVTDTYNGTTVKLGGTNTSKSVECADCKKDASGLSKTMPLTKKITTAWIDKPSGLASNVLLLNGLKEPRAAGAAKAVTDKYILSMSTSATANVGTRIVTQTSSGAWVDASTKAQAGQRFVAGPASIEYAAGSYGFDSVANTAWVVLDYEGTFAVRQYE
jgi:hypothetical protein